MDHGVYSFGLGLHTFTAVHRSIQPSDTVDTFQDATATGFISHMWLNSQIA